MDFLFIYETLLDLLIRLKNKQVFLLLYIGINGIRKISMKQLVVKKYWIIQLQQGKDFYYSTIGWVQLENISEFIHCFCFCGNFYFPLEIETTAGNLFTSYVIRFSQLSVLTCKILCFSDTTGKLVFWI